MKYDESKVLYPELSYKIYGLCYDIHNELGRFLKEQIYADAFEQKLKLANIAYLRETPFEKSFEGEAPRRNIPDFLIEETIIVDFKAKRLVGREEYYQMKRYLASSGKKLGLIINFRQPVLTPKRVLN